MDAQRLTWTGRMCGLTANCIGRVILLARRCFLGRKKEELSSSATGSSLEKALTVLGSLMESLPQCSGQCKLTFRVEDVFCEVMLDWSPSPSRITEGTITGMEASTPIGNGDSNTMSERMPD